MRKLLKYSCIGISGAMLFVSCKKNNLVVDKDVVAPAFAKFNTIQTNDTMATYYVRSTNDVYKLPVGVTSVSNVDRTIQFTYTGTAVMGTQFNAPASIVIKAGAALDSLTISGLFSGYPSSDRIDTIKIAIAGGDVTANAYKSKYYLILRKSCNVNLPDFYGAYDNSLDNPGTSDEYGPYSTEVVAGSFVSTGPASGTLQISNVWDYGGNDITVNLDWSDPNPSNFKLTIPDQKYKTSAGWWIKGTTAAGTFSSCDQTLTLKYNLYTKATGVIEYGNQVTVIAR
jgi:hypothetical protein